MEVRNIKYHIREDKHVRIIMPYVVYTKSKEDDKKQLKVSVPSFHMTDPSVWKMVIEKMKELLLKNYEYRERQRKTEEVSNDA
jgi:predicted solute-binding protein